MINFKALFQIWSEIEETDEKLVQFANTVALALSVLGLIFLWKSSPHVFPTFLIETVILICSTFYPKGLFYLYRYWMRFGTTIGWIMTQVLLILVFYVIITPLSLVLKLTGQEFLKTKKNYRMKSYWTPLKKFYLDKKDYVRQF